MRLVNHAQNKKGEEEEDKIYPINENLSEKKSNVDLKLLQLPFEHLRTFPLNTFEKRVGFLTLSFI